MEEFKIGNWYKSENDNYYKISEIKGNYFYYNEYISNNIWGQAGAGGWGGGWVCSLGSVLKEYSSNTISEIQPYLPDHHVDKIKNIESNDDHVEYLIKLLTTL